MPKVFEIFGYPIADKSTEATENRLAAQCPFMGRDCDGGGNRYQSSITLKNSPDLQVLYPNRSTLAAGVCSLQIVELKTPWIVCPRRLLVLGRERAGERVHQRGSETITLGHLGYPSGTRLGVWPEVKISYSETVADLLMAFDYTFDYVLMPVGAVSLAHIENMTLETSRVLRRALEAGGYTLGLINGEYVVEDFPIGVPSIIEIMTSSTSGGNKTKRTTIPAAFEDALLGREHSSPGINYRQVWARMVSQLIVKSEIALHWGGKTLWVVQDTLVDYITAQTALNVRQFLSAHTSEVNMLSFSYADTYKQPYGVLDLADAKLFAGPIADLPEGSPPPAPSFQDITRAPLKPSLARLTSALARRRPVNFVLAP